MSGSAARWCSGRSKTASICPACARLKAGWPALDHLAGLDHAGGDHARGRRRQRGVGQIPPGQSQLRGQRLDLRRGRLVAVGGAVELGLADEALGSQLVRPAQRTRGVRALGPAGRQAGCQIALAQAKIAVIHTGQHGAGRDRVADFGQSGADPAADLERQHRLVPGLDAGRVALLARELAGCRHLHGAHRTRRREFGLLPRTAGERQTGGQHPGANNPSKSLDKSPC